MRDLFKKFIAFDPFVRDQILMRLVLYFAWALITPIVHKLQGTLWTTSLISLYLICTRSAGLFVPHFKGIKLKNAYSMLVFLDFLYVIATGFYYIDPMLFLWSEVILTIVFLIFGELFAISFNLHIVDKYGKDVFEDVSYCTSFVFSISGILGFGCVIAMNQMMNEAYSVAFFIGFLSICLLLQVLNYFKHYRDI